MKEGTAFKIAWGIALALVAFGVFGPQKWANIIGIIICIWLILIGVVVVLDYYFEWFEREDRGAASEHH